tara:strand:+ start:362 stop:667 length:306 start_codon:yes stop_codon:yes gene_type:complete
MNFEDITLRVDASSRGGGIEIDLTSLGYTGHKMTAYQNYLGGGMLGSIGSDCTISDYRSYADLRDISENLKQYFHSLTNHVEDEWESASYEENQRRPSSAY